MGLPMSSPLCVFIEASVIIPPIPCYAKIKRTKGKETREEKKKKRRRRKEKKRKSSWRSGLGIGSPMSSPLCVFIEANNTSHTSLNQRKRILNNNKGKKKKSKSK